MKLVLAMGQHDSDYVDAYYGPPEWKKQEKKPLDAIDDWLRYRDPVTACENEKVQIYFGGVALITEKLLELVEDDHQRMPRE